MILTVVVLAMLSACGGGDSPASESAQNSSDSSYANVIESPDTASSAAVSSEMPDESTSEADAISVSTPPEGSTFSIHFIDVGQADSALVECDGHYMLIDGGNKEDSSRIYSILKNQSIPKLDIIVGTHAHEDHIGGLPGALNYASADLTLCPVTSYDSDAFNDFVKYADKNGGGITVPAVGDEYALGSASVKILGVNGGDDVNDTSIVLKIQYGATSFLFTGDAEREAEQAILNSGADLSATVLKVGHHGSDSSTTYPFLREIMPKYAVISVGAGNSYGHPSENTLSRLRDADATTYRTDMQGDIVCTSDGETVSFSTERNQDADTLTNPPAQEPTTTPQKETTPGPEQVQEQNQEPEKVGTNYVLNTNTKKFHKPSCSSVKTISDKNRKDYTGTRDEVIGMGYDPCGRCHP